MKRKVLAVIAFLVTGLGIIYFITATILGMNSTYGYEMFGWINITPLGIGLGLLNLLILMMAFILAVFWILFLISWLLKLRTLNNNDNVVNLH